MKALPPAAILAAAALAASCCGGPLPPAAPPSRPDAAPAPELGVPHAFRVGEGVFRGSQPTAEQMGSLAKAGVRTLVSFRTSKPDRDAAAAAGLAVVEIPIEADLESDPPTEAQVRLFFETLLDPARRPVYFHCLHGKDRTGTMAAIWRVEVDGWTNEEAIAEMKRLGFRSWYRDLEEFVRDYRPRGFRAPVR